MARILVVDDEPALRTLTARALAGRGHDVSTAEDGFDALEQIQARRDEIDLVLSDIRMPGMDGIELAETVAAQGLVDRIVLMTGYAEHRERAEQLKHVVRTVVEKPFTIVQIRQAVDDALNG